jgi:hypothetical protein
MARDNYGSYEAKGVPLVPMEPGWGNPDEGSAKLRQVLDNYYVDKTHPDTWKSDSDPSNPNRRIPRDTFRSSTSTTRTATTMATRVATRPS